MFDLKNIKIEHVLIIGVVIWYLCSKRNQENMSNSLIEIRVPVKCRDEKRPYEKKRKCHYYNDLVYDAEDIHLMRTLAPLILNEFPKGLNRWEATRKFVKEVEKYGIKPTGEASVRVDTPVYGLIGLYNPN